MLTLTATTADTGIANVNTDVADSTVVVDRLILNVTEEKDGVAVAGTTVTTVVDPDYSYSVLGQGTYGTVVDNLDGTLTYTPDTDYSGTDSFTFTKTDAAGNITTAVAEVTVIATADTPDITMSVNNQVVSGLTEQIVDGSFSIIVADTVAVDDGSVWKDLSGPGSSGNYNAYDATDDFVPTAGQAIFAKSLSIIQDLGSDLVAGDSYNLSLDIVLATELTARWVYIDPDNANAIEPLGFCEHSRNSA